MRKTSIYIEPEVDIALSRRAAREGTTKAEVVRNALRAAVHGSSGVKPQARGAFVGPPDLAENAAEHLSASGFGKS
jgi:hypothetical protein